MDQIINGLFKSTHSEKTKKQLFKAMRVSATSSLAKMNDTEQTKLINVCMHYALFGTDFDSQEAVSLLNSYLSICHNECFKLFTDDFFGNIVIGKYFSEFSEVETENTSSQLTVEISRRLSLIKLLLNIFAKKTMKPQLMYVQIHIKTEAIRLLYDCLDHKSFAGMCSFLLQHEDCMPPPSRFFALCSVSIHAMSDFNPKRMENDIIAVATYVSDISKIALLIQYIWRREPATLMPSLKEIFNIISARKDLLEPSNALGCLVEYIPSEMIQDVIAQIVVDPTVTDDQMMTALARMISWVGWPNATQAHLWVLTFFYQLQNLSKYSMLIEVTLKSIKQVLFCLRFPHTRAPALSVLLHMLLSFQSSSEAFHLIVPHIPQIFSEMEKEEQTEENKSYLLQLANLCHCMMFLHSGFPELYGPVLESLKAFPTPSKREIKSALNYNTWSANQRHRVFDHHLSVRSQETGSAGLVNLGNTCYINSVIQALFMINEFRNNILKMTPNPGSIMHALLETFAFLSLTKREAYEPKQLVEVSRPSWFNPGSQQDCSEYLKHVLDRLQEEEQSLRQSIKDSVSNNRSASTSTQEESEKDLSDAASISTSMIKDLFHGKLRSSIICSSCSYQSSRDETFIDIALPLNKAEERGGLAEELNKNAQTLSRHIEAAESSASRAFVGNPEELRSPVQVEDVEDEEEVVRRSHKLEDLLHDSLTEERMTGDNQYRCMDCNALRSGNRSGGIAELLRAALPTVAELAITIFFRENQTAILRGVTKQDAVKTTHITSLPKYLIITLLRFTYSLAEQRRSKVFDNVEIALEIEVPLHEDASISSSMIRYKLASVVVHSGLSAESGHYYCYAKKSEDGIERWCLFNDSHVSLTTFQSLNNLTDQFSRDTAYVLFYARADLDLATADDKELIEKTLRQKIEDDNLAFEKEIEEASKRLSAENKTCPANVIGWNDDNPPPPPTCGGGDGQVGPGFLVC